MALLALGRLLLPGRASSCLEGKCELSKPTSGEPHTCTELLHSGRCPPASVSLEPGTKQREVAAIPQSLLNSLRPASDKPAKPASPIPARRNHSKGFRKPAFCPRCPCPVMVSSACPGVATPPLGNCALRTCFSHSHLMRSPHPTRIIQPTFHDTDKEAAETGF